MKRLLQPFQLSKRQMARVRSILPDEEPILRKGKIIPVCEPDLSGNEAKYVSDAIKSSWISSGGPYIERFEGEFAKKVSGTRFARAVNSGTSGLHLSLLSCGIGKGDEVIVPTFTMIATVNAICFTGATPVFIDADPETWNMNVEDIASKITKKTRGIMVVHIYGLPVDMDPVLQLGKKHSLWVIEDASEAHGATYKGKRIGSIGDIAAFSLYANKIVATGEGGMVTTNNAKLAERVYLLREHAFSGTRHFWHTYNGYNYCMSNLAAAIGYGQMEHFDKLVRNRQNNARLYTRLLSAVPGLQLPVQPAGMTNVYWMYGIVVDARVFGIDKNELRKRLAARGIETRSFFIPIHLQPPYIRDDLIGKYPVSERLCRDGFYVPSSGTLTPKEIDYICQQIRL